MNLLNNPLVRKYFGYAKCYWDGESCLHNVCRSELILSAMQAPIRKGERYLEWYGSTPIIESTAWWDIDAPHQINIRLPDQFQPEKRKECSNGSGHCFCRGLLGVCCWCGFEKPPVPEPEKCDCEGLYHEYKNHPNNFQNFEPSPTNVVSDPVEGKICDSVGTKEPCSCKPIDEVEEKIKEIVDNSDKGYATWLKIELRELVALARKGSR